MLAKAPLLDVILNGAEGTDWDKAVFAVLMDIPGQNSSRILANKRGCTAASER